MKRELIYLASPYHAPTKLGRQHNYEKVRDATLALMNQGHIVYSPIVHMHPLELVNEQCIRGDCSLWDYYKTYDEVFLSKCDELWILCIDGWRESKGVRGEIEIADRLEIPVRLVTVHTNVDSVTYELYDSIPKGGLLDYVQKQ